MDSLSCSLTCIYTHAADGENIFQTDLSVVIPVSVLSLFLVLSLTTATAIFVVYRMKICMYRNPKNIEAGMKQDFKLKMTQCDIAEHKASVSLAPNRACIGCDIPKYSSVPVFSNEAYNVLKAGKVSVLSNAACNVAQCSTSTMSQEMKHKKSLSGTKNSSTAPIQAKAESACSKVPVHPNEAYAVAQSKNKVSCYAKVPVYPNGAYAVPHRKNAVETEGPGLTKVAVYPNEVYVMPHRKAEISSEAPGQAKVAFTPNEAYGIGDQTQKAKK